MKEVLSNKYMKDPDDKTNPLDELDFWEQRGKF